MQFSLLWAIEQELENYYDRFCHQGVKEGRKEEEEQ
jgi:hypothetical protein